MAEIPAGRSESLAGKAIRIYNTYAQPLEYKFLGTGCQYKFDREKLTPDYLTMHDLRVKADEFLACKNGDKSFDLLRELGAAERVYSSPKMSLKNWFGELTDDFLKRPNVQLDFNECQKINLKGLLENISKNGLAEDARTLLLFRKALNNFIDLTVHDAINLHILNFGSLTPARMKEKNITNKKIEDLIDSSNSKTVTNFLKETGALVIKKISIENLRKIWLT